MIPKHQDYFGKGLEEVVDPNGLINDLKRAMSTIKNPMEKINAAYPRMMEECQKSIPEVERMPIHFYEDGISSLKGRLSIICKRYRLDYFSGDIYAFRDENQTQIGLLTYDGHGIQWCIKRYSEGRISWWPHDTEVVQLLPRDLQIMLWGGKSRRN